MWGRTEGTVGCYDDTGVGGRAAREEESEGEREGRKGAREGRREGRLEGGRIGEREGVRQFPIPCRREPKSDLQVYEISADSEVPRMSFVSTVVNQPVVRPYLFTTYRHHPANLDSVHYPGTTDVKIWEALMATTAVPGYFEEVKLGDYVHQVTKNIKYHVE